MNRGLLREQTLSPESLSDHALLEAMGGQGSRAALRELFDRHGATVHRLVSLVVADPDDVDPLVEDVFVSLSRRHGRLEDDVENVRLGLLAMAWRRSRPADDAAGRGDGNALALTVLAAATLTEVAAVLQVNRRAVAAELRAGLLSARA